MLLLHQQKISLHLGVYFFNLDPILVKFWDQLIRFDVDFLARSSGLIESLADTTVICSIDREGTISKTFPSVDKLFFLNEDADPIILDVVELEHSALKFEDNDWKTRIDLLKPIGLNILLNSDCSTTRRKNEVHWRVECPLLNGNIHTSQQSCLCQLSRIIGFQENVLSRYTTKKSIQTFINSVDDLNGLDVPFATIFSRVFEDSNSRSINIMSDGDVRVILACCNDFWNGVGLSPITESCKKRVYQFYNDAIISDMEVMGFSYGFIENEKEKDKKLLFLEIGKDFKCIDKEKEKVLEYMIKDQTFLGLVSFQHNPKIVYQN